MSKRSIVVRGVREAVPGVTPADEMHEHPAESFTFDSSIQRETAGDFTASGEDLDHPAVGVQVSGSGKYDLSYPSPARRIIEEEVFCAQRLAAVQFLGSDEAITADPSGNKLVRASGWAGLVAGDMVAVANLGNDSGSTNPSFFVARVASVSGADLGLDPGWRTLAASANSATAMVYRSSRQRLGGESLTSTWELWRPNVGRGEIYRAVSHKSLQIAWSNPGKVSASTSQEALTLSEKVTDRLANSTAALEQRSFYTGVQPFGDAYRPTAGLGFRWGGALATEALIQSLQLSLERPRLITGGAGYFGGKLINPDGQFAVRFTMTAIAAATSADVELPTWVDDASQSDFATPIAWGWADADGWARLYCLSRLQFTKAHLDGREKTGDQLATFEAMASPAAGSSQLEIHDFAPPSTIVA